MKFRIGYINEAQTNNPWEEIRKIKDMQEEVYSLSEDLIKLISKNKNFLEQLQETDKMDKIKSFSKKFKDLSAEFTEFTEEIYKEEIKGSVYDHLRGKK